MKKKIMLVEDDSDIRHSLQQVLERVGYEVVVIPDGDVLINGGYELPELYILDNQLPGVSGLDLCRMLKKNENTRHIPVLMLSASPHIGRQAAESGANAWLEKPFRMQELRSLVADLII